MKNIEYRVTLGIKNAIFEQDPEPYKALWKDLLQNYKFATEGDALRYADKLLDKHPKVSPEICVIIGTYDVEKNSHTGERIYYEGRDALKRAVKETY